MTPFVSDPGAVPLEGPVYVSAMPAEGGEQEQAVQAPTWGQFKHTMQVSEL
jgi:hypothetical protein